MNERGHPPTRPLGPPGVDDRRAARTAPKARTLRYVLVLCLGSLAVIVPWPLLAIIITRSSFESWDEAVLLFGGVTAIPAMILVAIGAPEAIFVPLLVLAWPAAVVVPDVWLAPRLTSRRAVGWLLGTQAAFSFAQAAVGALMVIGENV